MGSYVGFINILKMLLYSGGNSESSEGNQEYGRNQNEFSIAWKVKNVKRLRDYLTYRISNFCLKV